MEDYKEAEKLAQESVTMFMEVCQTSPPREIMDNALESIAVLQSVHIARGHPEVSEKMYEEIVVPNFAKAFENVEFFTYLMTLSGFYARNDFPQFTESKCQMVLDMYGEFSERLDLSLEEQPEADGEILKLVTSARSLLGHQLLNQGKEKEALGHFSRFEKDNYKYLTISKRLDVMEATFLYKLGEDDGFVAGQFVIEINLQNKRKLSPNTRLSVILGMDGQIDPTASVTGMVGPDSKQVIQIRTGYLTSVSRGRHIATLEMFDQETEERYIHRQTIWVEHPFSHRTTAESFVAWLTKD